MKRITARVTLIAMLLNGLGGGPLGAAPTPETPLIPIPTRTPKAEAGVLVGTVKATDGTPLPGVSVSIQGPALPGVRSAVTNGKGEYRVAGLPPGTYKVTFTLAGFTSVVRDTTVIDVGGEFRCDAMLPLAAVMDSLTVTADAPAVSMSQSSTSDSFAGVTSSVPSSRSFQSISSLRAGLSQNPHNIQPLPAGPSLRDFPVINGKPFPDMYFKNFGVNPTIDTDEEPTSTFSVDVDTASYTLARSYLNRGVLPEPDAVRVEEFVNSFDYRYAPPKDGTPFALYAEAFPSPVRRGYHLLHLGIKGRAVSAVERKTANVVFCIDVSGSMDIENRLGLVKKALRLLVNQLNESDKVGIVVYGTTARVVLEPTSAHAKAAILEAIDRLAAEGSTNAQAGLEEAYKMAARHLRKGGTNRIILCSDGVANNGITGADAIFERVKRHADEGITITTVGFGMGNYNDVLMERLAHVGNGNYAYVDRLEAARKIFVDQLSGTLEVIAKDAKIQLELDPERVARYRLLGYEKRMLKTEDFHDDSVDAGEVGAGHTVTALYELKLKPGTGPLGTLRIRYKAPEGGVSSLVERELTGAILRPSLSAASSPARLSFLAAGFAEKLRSSYWARAYTYDDLAGHFRRLPAELRGTAEVAELGDLMHRARNLDKRVDRFASVSPVSEMDFDKVPVLR